MVFVFLHHVCNGYVLKFEETCCLHFLGDQIWIRCLLKYVGEGNTSIAWASFNDFANQSYRDERVGVGSSSWCKTLHFFLHCSLDWPISFKPSYITDLFPPSNHLIIHLNKIQPLWKWWQQAALKCQNKPIKLHGVRIRNTTMWATHTVNTWNSVTIKIS
jgi:hypothetical protein